MRNEIVVVQAHLELAALAARVDVGRLGVHHADAAARARLEVVDVALRDAAIGRAIVPFHRRADDPVLHFHRADAARLEQFGKPHDGVAPATPEPRDGGGDSGIFSCNDASAALRELRVFAWATAKPRPLFWEQQHDQR